MRFAVHPIRHPALKPYIQYILFNSNDRPDRSTTVTAYANSNICLGVVKGKTLVPGAGGHKVFEPYGGITSYLSGIYVQPHHFEVRGLLDEICIDFTPLGYYAFFRMPVRTYIFGEDVLSEAFGREAKVTFESIFTEIDFGRRARKVETFSCADTGFFSSPFCRSAFSISIATQATSPSGNCNSS